jgi:hypothetical protein
VNVTAYVTVAASLLAEVELMADESTAGFDGCVGAGGDDPQLINNKSGAKPARRMERL